MPKPPAAFSPLMATKSSFHCSRKAGSRLITTSRPACRRCRRGRADASAAPRRKDESFLGQDEIEPLIVRFERHLLHLLHGEADADGSDLFLCPQRRERHV